MIEEGMLTDKAVEEMKQIIYDEKLNQEITEHNYNLGKKLFSYDTLEEKLQELLAKALKVA